MQLRNALSKWQSDNLYEPLKPLVQVDLSDNNEESIVVGTTSEKRIYLEYTFVLPLLDKSQTGTFVITSDASGVDLDHHYSFPGTELDEVTFEVEINGTDILLIITTISLGENPVLTYRKSSIEQ